MKNKSPLHRNNPLAGRYNFQELVATFPELKECLKSNPMGDKTIDFSDDNSVLLLNKALLKYYYKIENWDIPEGYLCPPIPGRADYIHYISDLLNYDDTNVTVLDIGTGANFIYPIIGSQTFKWHFTATEIDPVSIENANKIIENNKNLKGFVRVREQENKSNIFSGIIKPDEYYHLTMCNPPFHASLKEAREGNLRKIRNLNRHKSVKIEEKLNFGGQGAELWCPGGEMFFLKKMINESVQFKNQVGWFTSLVSKGDNVSALRRMVKSAGAKKVKVLEMSQGQKISRIIAWTFNK